MEQVVSVGFKLILQHHCHFVIFSYGQADFVYPNNGTLAAVNDMNISSAQNGNLELSYPWLDSRSQAHFSRNEITENHPVTGVATRFCLFDKLHVRNTKKRGNFATH